MKGLIGIAILAVCALIAIGAEPAAAASQHKKPAVTKTVGKAKSHSSRRKAVAQPAKQKAARKIAAKQRTQPSSTKTASAKKNQHARVKHAAASTGSKRKKSAKQQSTARRQKPVARRTQPARIEPPLEDAYLLGFTDDPAAPPHFSKLPAMPNQDVHTEMLLGSATEALDQGRPEESIDTLRKLLDRDARHVRARALLAAALTQSHRNSEAAAVLKDGLVSTPDDTTLTRLYARVLLDMGDSQGALTTLARVPAERADAGHHAFVAALEQKLGQHRQAVAAYERAIVAGCPANCWVGMGISLEALGQTSEASAAFARAAQAPALEAQMRHYAQTRLTLLSGSAD